MQNNFGWKKKYMEKHLLMRGQKEGYVDVLQGLGHVKF